MKVCSNKLILISVLSLLFVGNNFAQQKKYLTLRKSIEIGLENSRSIHISRLKVKEAEARWREINTLGLPSLKFNTSYTRLSQVPPFAINTPFGRFNISPSIFNNYSLKLSLQQPIFTGFKISSNSDMAKYNSLAAKQQFSQDEQDLILNIKTAFWNLFKAKKIKEAVKDNLQEVEAHLNDIRNFYKQGLVTKNEVLKVAVRLSEVQLNQIDAKNAVKLAIINLDNVLGLSLSTELEIQDSISINNSKDDYNLGELIKEALTNRPALKSMQYKVKASKKGIVAAKSDWYPQIFLSGEYDYAKPNRRLLPTRNKFYATWAVSIGMSYDLWNWGSTEDRTDQAKAQFEQAEDGLKTLKDAVILEVTNDYFNMIKAKEKILVTKQTINQAKENYRVTRDKFEQGLALNSELIDAETSLKLARTNNVQALVEYEIVKAKIEKATGSK